MRRKKDLNLLCHHILRPAAIIDTIYATASITIIPLESSNIHHKLDNVRSICNSSFNSSIIGRRCL